MTQNTPIIGSDLSGLEYRTEDNAGKQALLNHHKGNTAPAYAEAGCIWLDDSATPWVLKIYDGADWIKFAEVNASTNALNVINHSSDITGKTAATIASGDKLIFADVSDSDNLKSGTVGGIADVVAGAARTYTGAQKPSETTLTSSSAHIAIDLSANNDFAHTFTENTTLDNPSNITVGQSGAIRFTQHASAPKTLAFGSYWDFAGGTAPSVTATNSARDTLFYHVRSTTQIEASMVNNWS